MECKNKSDKDNNRCDWNHLKITQTVPEQHTGESTKLKNCKKNSHIGHCTQTAGSADVTVQNIFNMRNNITCSTNCKYRTAVTLYTAVRWVVSGT